MANMQHTVKAGEAIQAAVTMAAERGNPEVIPTHLLLALLEQPEGVVPRLVEKVGVSTSQLKQDVFSDLDRLPRAEGGSDPRPSRDFGRVMDQAAKLAPQFQDEYVSVEHLLLGIVSVPSCSAAGMLALRGVDQKSLLAAIQELRGSHRVTDDSPEAKYEALKNYGCWWAIPASARPPSPKGWPSASPPATFPRPSRASASSPSTWGL